MHALLLLTIIKTIRETYNIVQSCPVIWHVTWMFQKLLFFFSLFFFLFIELLRASEKYRFEFFIRIFHIHTFHTFDIICIRGGGGGGKTFPDANLKRKESIEIELSNKYLIKCLASYNKSDNKLQLSIRY